MFIIVGLGNPGEEYENTRHNVGRMAVSYFARHQDKAVVWKNDQTLKLQKTKVDIDGEVVTCVLPDTYMNLSGSAVAPFIVGEKKVGPLTVDLKKKIEKKASKLIVIQDDLDLPLGKIKIVCNRGSGGHRGIESIKKSIKTEAFVRIKIGIVPETPTGKLKKPSGEEKVVRFILGAFQIDETKVLKKVFSQIPEIIEVIVHKGTLEAMNQFN